MSTTAEPIAPNRDAGTTPASDGAKAQAGRVAITTAAGQAARNDDRRLPDPEKCEGADADKASALYVVSMIALALGAGLTLATTPRLAPFHPFALALVIAGSAGAVATVTLMRQAHRRREHAQYAELSRVKNDFVAMVSHELRTPLASIRAYAEMLIDGEADDDLTRGEFYEVIQKEANRLARLIDNILSISRIESGLAQVMRDPLNLADTCRAGLEVLTPQAREKHILLTAHGSLSHYPVRGDGDLLYQTVVNLLSNAIKYTPDGGRVTLRIDTVDAGRGVRVRVEDTGVGIPPKDLPFVFDKFYRSEANSRMAPGTGLGLALVKHIIETAHGGRMIVDSEVGRGSCFGFELPSEGANG